MAKAKKLPSGKWRIRVFSHKTADGKLVYKSFTAETKKEAEYLAAAFAAKKRCEIENITVGHAIDRYIQCKTNVLSPTTIDGYQKIRRNHLKQIINTPLDKLTREMVQKCINEEAASSSPKTVSNVYGLLRAAIIMQNPEFPLHIRLPRKARSLNRELPTSEEVIRAVRGSTVELPVLLSLWLCLRMSEVRGIKKGAIHDDKLFIENVIVTIGGRDIEKSLAKTDSTRRVVKLPPQLKEMILAQDGEYATTLSRKAIYSRFKRLMEKSGYDNVRFHDLRHIAASDMNRLGITDRVAADRGGWSTTTTMRNVYQHSFEADRVSADEKVSDYYEELLKKFSEDTK